MAIYEFPIPQDRADALVDRTAESVQAYLANRGIAVAYVNVRLNPPTLVVSADRDPTPFLASVPWPQKRNRAQARTAMKAFMDKVNAGQAPTNAEVIAAIRGIIVELARD